MKSKNNTLISLLFLVVLAGCCGGDQAIKQIDRFITEQKIDKQKNDWKTQLTEPPLLTFTETKDYFWELETNQGKLIIKLFKDTAPMHVSSTVYLTKLGFYDNLTFHRVIPGFMAQGGDPVGNGTGNPGYKYNGEFEGDIGHGEAGMLSMANAGPGTDGSQFFITFTPTPFLDGKHTVFGKVIEDPDNTLEKMEALGSRRGKTKEPVVILKASIKVTDSK